MAPVVELARASVRFEGGALALDRLDLVLEPGALVGLIGPPSSGKSVLLKVIAGLVRPVSGALRGRGDDREGSRARGEAPTASPAVARALDTDLFSTDPSSRRELQRHVGMLFQNNALFDSLTVLDNVAFPLRRQATPPPEDDILARARARLVEVGLGHAFDRFPHELSGGMQKRCGIARATVAEPRLRLFDEPTAGLDPVTCARILALITGIHARQPSGVTLIVSNEMDSLLAAVPRLVVLDAGRLLWDGPTAQLSTAPAAVRGFVSGEGIGPTTDEPVPPRAPSAP